MNEFSTRYSSPPDVADKTSFDAWRKQATTNRQGSSDETVQTYPSDYRVVDCDGEYFEVWTPEQIQTIDGKPTTFGGGDTPPTAGQYLSAKEYELQTKARQVYEERLKFGVAKEQARKDLPLSTYTTAYWQSDLRNLLGFLSLRMDGHAQWEIRQYANVIGREIIAKLYPVTWQAFLDYDLNSMRLTALDIQVIQNIRQYTDGPNRQASVGDFMNAQHPAWVGLDKCRERDECLAKLRALGLVQAA